MVSGAQGELVQRSALSQLGSHAPLEPSDPLRHTFADYGGGSRIRSSSFDLRRSRKSCAYSVQTAWIRWSPAIEVDEAVSHPHTRAFVSIKVLRQAEDSVLPFSLDKTCMEAVPCMATLDRLRPNLRLSGVTESILHESTVTLDRTKTSETQTTCRALHWDKKINYTKSHGETAKALHAAKQSACVRM